MLGPRNDPTRRQPGETRAPSSWQADPDVELPGRPGETSRQTELEHRDRAAGSHDAGELAHRRSGVVDIAEQIREGERVEGCVLEREPLGGALDEFDPVLEARRLDPPAAGLEHVGALVESDDVAAGPAGELDRNGGSPGRHVEHGVLWADLHPRDQEAAPVRILAEGEQPGVSVVGRSERCEQLEGVHRARVYGGPMALTDDLERIAAAAAGYAADGEELSGVLAAEPHLGGRVYLCAYRGGDGWSWLALDDGGEAISDRELVRRAASLVALCEVAEESAGGGELDELRSRLVALRLTENPPGIDEAEEAVLALQRVIGGTPRLATAAYLDEIGAATRRLEETLGDAGMSPFAEAMKSASAAVEDFTTDVESHYKRDLS